MAQLSTYFSLENTNRHDAARLKQQLDTLPGVTSVSINDNGGLAVDYDSTGIRHQEIRDKVQALGYCLREGE